jgi:hypothetical protein
LSATDSTPIGLAFASDTSESGPPVAVGAVGAVEEDIWTPDTACESVATAGAAAAVFPVFNTPVNTSTAIRTRHANTTQPITMPAIAPPLNPLLLVELLDELGLLDEIGLLDGVGVASLFRNMASSFEY